MASYYNIDSAHGNELSAGIQSEIVARRHAQETANRLNEPVYLYQVGSGEEAVEITPEPSAVTRAYLVYVTTADCEGSWATHAGCRLYASRAAAEAAVAADPTAKPDDFGNECSVEIEEVEVDDAGCVEGSREAHLICARYGLCAETVSP